jgi:hypothetical protein
VAGALDAPGGDFLSVVVNNGGANKVDFYAKRTLDYSIRLGADGRGSATARFHLVNWAPRAGPPPEVIGPVRGLSKAGENVSFVSMYGARSSEITMAEPKGELPQREGAELGHRYHQTYVKVPSGTATTLVYRVAVPHAWEDDNGYGGTYRLTFHNQPTIHPTLVRIAVTVPDGMHITSPGKGMRISDDQAVWEGTPGDRLELEVSFSKSLLARIWRSAVRFFT